MSEEKEDTRFYFYENGSGANLVIEMVIDLSETTYRVDSEDAQVIQNIEINGYEGVYIEKDSAVHIAWADTDRSVYFGIFTNSLDGRQVLEMSSQIKYIGE